MSRPFQAILADLFDRIDAYDSDIPAGLAAIIDAAYVSYIDAIATRTTPVSVKDALAAAAAYRRKYDLPPAESVDQLVTRLDKICP